MPEKAKALLENYGTIANRLSFRLFALMALALFPLGIIAVYQTDQVLDETERLRHNALFFETSSAARDERELIQQTLGSAQGLAALSSLDDTETCRSIMREFAENNAHIVFAGYVRLSGLMECSSDGGTLDFAGTEGLRKAIEAGGPSIEVVPRGAVTGLPVLLANQPVYQDRKLTGFVSLSVPLRLADRELRSHLFDHTLRVVTFTNEGLVVSASGGRENAESILPRDIPLQDLSGRVGTTFEGISGTGEDRIFAVAGLFQDQVSVIASWPATRSIWGGGAASYYLANLLFPLTIWAAGLAFALYELRRVVIRHLRGLRSAMRQFALGQRDNFPLKLDNPPEEFAEAERAFNRMAILITDSEERQAKDLKDKEVLLKEVHHRVKNNLQMIASIMNMQSRNATTPEARLMLSSLQRRVNGLAMLHRTLYTTPDLLTIEATELLEAVVKDISTVMSIPGLVIERDIAPLPLYPDQAVPLSMLLAEALTNALKYVGANPGEKPYIRVALKQEDDERYKLSVTNSKGEVTSGTVQDQIAGGLGTKLMMAFVSQLEGEQTIVEDDTTFELHVLFEKKDFETKSE